MPNRAYKLNVPTADLNDPTEIPTRVCKREPKMKKIHGTLRYVGAVPVQELVIAFTSHWGAMEVRLQY